MSRADNIAIIQAHLQTFSTHVYLFQQQIAEKMNLHPTDFHSIHLLDRYGPMTVGQIATRLGLTSGATTAAIDRLVARDYAERVASNDDRRSTIIQLQPHSIKKMRQEYAGIAEQIKDGLEQFSEAELASIDRFLQMLVEL